MAKKYHLLYEGTAAGQAVEIVCCGYVFYRGTSTEVSKEVFDRLTDQPGFKAGKQPAKPADKE